VEQLRRGQVGVPAKLTLDRRVHQLREQPRASNMVGEADQGLDERVALLLDHDGARDAADLSTACPAGMRGFPRGQRGTEPSDAQEGGAMPEDVVTLLHEQHRRIRAMFDAVQGADDGSRGQRFEELRAFLAVHETAEELVVHPRVRMLESGNEVVDARLAEEHAAKALLADLDGMDVAEPSFDGKLAALRTAVLEHAESEEREEFPLLRARTDAKTLTKMAQAVRAAEAIAPTHPHPGVESMTANLVVGPLASVVDRTRDAVRAVLQRS
jgi:hemerythrin superfamily protein